MHFTPSAAAEHDVPPPPRADTTALALFIDLDGTLLDFAARPDAVVVDDALPATLQRLKRRLGGALAPVSGRPLREIDALLGLDGAAAGLHGAELRAPDGLALEAPAAHGRLDAARMQAARATAVPGVLVEDKRNAIALHYRGAPGAAPDVRRIATAMLDAAGDGYELMHGAFVVELKPSSVDKGTAIAALMRIEPFAGRTPWVIGDDVTDEDAFAEANDRGGVSIIVGPRRPTAARYGLPGPAAARAWLGRLAGVESRG
ncbi:MAG TPA: trehalose-phosphatase [Rhodanobacteraceae bacterium]|nr:trehalose-phosphatase [Rhodanobacteraceae bacterium]